MVIKYWTLALINIISIHSYSQNKFILEGTLTGYEDGIKFVISPYLDDMTVNRDKDSVFFLSNDKFKIIRTINKPTKFALRALPKMPPDDPKDFEFIEFWTENKPMTLKGEKGKLLYSDISGSIIQDQHEEFINDTRELELINNKIKDSVLNSSLTETVKISLRKIYNDNYAEIEKRQLNFIYNHPDYYSSIAHAVFYINYFPHKISKPKMTKFYNTLSDDFKNNIYGNQIKKYLGSTIQKNNDLKIGDKPHNFKLPDSNGDLLELASKKGKMTLLDFWASGCGPCRKEHKNYLEYFQKFHGKGFEIISVSQDQSKKQWLNAMQKDNMIWSSVWDSDRAITKAYNVSFIPHNYLINEQGIIIAKNIRGKQLEVLLNSTLSTK